MRETGAGMHMHQHRVQVHKGVANRCGYEGAWCRPAPSVRLPSCLPACLSWAEINSRDETGHTFVWMSILSFDNGPSPKLPGRSILPAEIHRRPSQ